MNERPNEQVLRRKKKHQRILLKRKQKDRQTDKHDITRHIDKLIDTQIGEEKRREEKTRQDKTRQDNMS